VKSISFDDLDIAGLRQQSGDIPVLALHGWLDNANSFLGLADDLDGVDLVAIDFPGHGLSGTRPHGARFYFDDHVFDVLAVADALGWQRFHLLGHSLGGAVSSLVAAACPKCVISMVLIEGLGPISARADQTASGWRKAVKSSRIRPRRVHSNREAAIQARANNSDLTLNEARTLAERGLKSVDGGFAWSHDPRLTWPSTHRYTESQVIDLIGAIEAPVLNIYSDPPSGILPGRILQRRLAALRQRKLFSHPGGHHLHMQHPATIGPVIKEFFHEHKARVAQRHSD
jgi:pimeloyl-ACP methyl ester carboxylesterase